MRVKYAAVVAGLALGLMSGTAKAAYMIDIDQIGTSLEVTGSGSLDLSGATFDFNLQGYGASLRPANPIAVVADGPVDVYSVNFQSMEAFGTSDKFPLADLSSGPPVGAVFYSNYLLVPTGYTSNSPLLPSTSTYFNTTFSDLGLTAGSSYTYDFLTGSKGTDSIIINIGSLSAVPLPASAPMFGAGLLALGVVGYGLKRKGKAAAAV